MQYHPLPPAYQGLARESRTANYPQGVKELHFAWQKNRFRAPGEAPIPIGHHFADFLALHVVLRTTKVAGNNRKFHAARKLGNLTLGTISKRPNDHMGLIVGNQLRWHRFQLATKQHVEEQGVNHVVAMVAERNLVGTQLFCRPVNYAATQS